MPQLVGGLAGLAEKVRYPDDAKRAGIQGRVFLQFVVERDGSVVNPVVVRGIGAGCDEAALEALRASTFTPGKQRGKNVAVKMSLPVVFRLN
jgi:protein TonB